MRIKDILKLTRRAAITGEEKIPVSKDEFVTVGQIAEYVGYTCLLDLTTLSYPESGRKVAADVWSNIPLTISIKVAEAEPLRTVVHIETVSDQYYRLFTGDIGSVEDDGHGRLHQICYLLNRTDGTVKAEKYVSKSNIVTASALESYVRKDARLIINCGSPTDLTTKK